MTTRSLPPVNPDDGGDNWNPDPNWTPSYTPMPVVDDLTLRYGSDLVDALPPWLVNHPELASRYLDEIIEAGGTSNTNSAVIALETIRMAPEHRQAYDAAFPGMRREDGSLRMTEGVYQAEVQSMRSHVAGFGLNPDIFTDEYAEFIGGDGTAAELGQRIDAVYTRVLSSAGAIRDFYGENYGIDMTDEGILASIMSPNIENAVLSKQITMAEIGGEASMRNFDITTQFVDLLEDNGMDRAQAQQFFGSAETLLPTLAAMAARHGDVDDDFDIMELAQGMGVAGSSAGQDLRLRRIQAQESSSFTGGSQVDYVRGEGGGVAGLDEL